MSEYYNPISCRCISISRGREGGREGRKERVNKMVITFRLTRNAASSFPFQRAVPRDANGRDDKRERGGRRNGTEEEGRRERSRRSSHLAHLTDSAKIFVRRKISTFAF